VARQSLLNSAGSVWTVASHAFCTPSCREFAIALALHLVRHGMNLVA